jgi:chromosome segregation ATPase
MVSEEERMIGILEDIKRDIEELSSRKSNIISTTNMTIETIIDDVRAIPAYIESVKRTLEEIQQVNKELEEKIMQTQQAVETVQTEIEIQQANKSDLNEAEIKKREYKENLERQIANLQEKKTTLEAELESSSATTQHKETEYNLLQESARSDLENMNQKIKEAEVRLQKIKEDNKLIVYLMEAGLLDVPEAEIVSVIASYPNGLKLDEIKEKVSMPPVRVQPTINTLLEKVVEHDSYSDSYKILESIKKEFV